MIGDGGMDGQFGGQYIERFLGRDQYFVVLALLRQCGEPIQISARPLLPFSTSQRLQPGSAVRQPNGLPQPGVGFLTGLPA
jgi:hypothetical protein